MKLAKKRARKVKMTGYAPARSIMIEVGGTYFPAELPVF